MTLTTPRGDGFHMPAEWAPHSATVMLWPERPDNWRDGAAPAQSTFVAVATAIARFEPVVMLVSPRQYDRARSFLPEEARLLTIDSDDAWARDIAPVCVTDGRNIRAVDFLFNAWGGLEHGLYAPWDRDDALAARLCAELDIPRYRAPCVLEGGAIHTDGEGTILTTEPCLLDPARNQGVTRAAMEEWLGAYLGARHVVWLQDGVPEDETGGHVDNLACFVSPGRVLLSWCDDPADPHHVVSRAALARLETAHDAAGRRLVVEKLPMPTPMFISEAEAAGVAPGDGGMNRRAGTRLAASYVNFYLANGAVIAPAFGVPTDDPAREILARCFPGRQIVMLPAREILLGGGNIHCITSQLHGPSATKTSADLQPTIS